MYSILFRTVSYLRRYYRRVLNFLRYRTADESLFCVWCVKCAKYLAFGTFNTPDGSALIGVLRSSNTCNTLFHFIYLTFILQFTSPSIFPYLWIIKPRYQKLVSLDPKSSFEGHALTSSLYGRWWYMWTSGEIFKKKNNNTVGL